MATPRKGETKEAFRVRERERHRAAREKARGGLPKSPRGRPRIADDPPASTSGVSVRARVIESAAPTLDIPAPVHSSGATVPEAGSEIGAIGGGSTPATPGAAAPSVVALDPAVMTSLGKGLFALVALRGGEHWKVEDDEIEPIAEPLCRQAMRIPFVAALGQNAADLILIGSTMGALIYMRAEQSVKIRKLEAENARLRAAMGGAPRETGVDRHGNIVEMRPARGETVIVDAASAGNRMQEVREPDEPAINLGPFRASG